VRHLTRLGLLIAAVLLLAVGAAAGGVALLRGPSAAPASTDRVVSSHSSRWFRLAEAGAAPLVPNHENYAARSRTAGPLLLFLPATGEKPADYSRLLTAASRQGYHVLGLDYWNLGRTVASTCNRDAACYGDVQRNRFDGSSPVPQSRVAPQDSVLGRLVPALAYLRRQDPHGGWGRYTADGRIRWQDVVVAGHSQGGGEAAYIAHTHAVRGALLFGAPIVTDGDVAATWLSTPGRTPASRVFAFDDSHDVFFPRITASWQRLGLGAPRLVSPTTTRFTGHALVETLPMRHAHLRVASDATPLDAAGDPVFASAWSWMLSRFI
jgi:hypothetical protein